jgi:hypothetical protein
MLASRCLTSFSRYGGRQMLLASVNIHENPKATYSTSKKNETHDNFLAASISKRWGMVMIQHSSFSSVPKLPSVNTFYSVQLRALSSPSFKPPDDGFVDGKPTLKYASSLNKTWASMSNEQILHFAHEGVPEACRECIIRDVMMVDQIAYDEVSSCNLLLIVDFCTDLELNQFIYKCQKAYEVFNKIAASNREGMQMYALPFQIGCAVAVTGGWISFPLVFNESAVTWFNSTFVTAELPPPEDMETWLEVGSASWGWMEPVLGQVSFFLLCMQFARAQLQNLGIRPYFNMQKKMRADRLVALFPQYDEDFLRQYSECDQLASPHKFSP